MPEKISRADAVRLGLTHYDATQPCPYGHPPGRRSVKHRMCMRCRTERAAREARQKPELAAAYHGAAYARRSGTCKVPETYTVAECVPFYAKARRLTDETGVPHSVDHVVPLSRGGEHAPANLQVLTLSENARKGARVL